MSRFKPTRKHDQILRMISERPSSFNPEYGPVQDLVQAGWAYWKRGAFGRNLLHMTHPEERPQ